MSTGSGTSLTPSSTPVAPGGSVAGFAKKVHFVSLGCPKNLVDSEIMLGHMMRDGYSVTDTPEDA